MKPGPRDAPYPLLITGRELQELKRFTWAMTESFGLDRRIERYAGRRPLRMYRWDLDCLDAVVSAVLVDAREYPRQRGAGYEAMKQLSERIRQLREEAYA